MKTLIVIDMQKDFIDGALGTKEAVEIVPKVKQKIAEYVNRGDEIIFTRDTHSENYLNTHEGKNLPVPHCIKGTEGWEIPSGIDIPECRHIDKTTFGYDCWEFEPFDGEYKVGDIDEIEIIGLCTDICVVSNALILRATYPEFEITVDASCCAGTTPEMHEAALDVMRSCQINIINRDSFEDKIQQASQLILDATKRCPPMDIDTLKQLWQTAEQTTDVQIVPDSCMRCPNRPSNGGSGICHCILGQPAVH